MWRTSSTKGNHESCSSFPTHHFPALAYKLLFYLLPSAIYLRDQKSVNGQQYWYTSNTDAEKQVENEWIWVLNLWRLIYKHLMRKQCTTFSLFFCHQGNYISSMSFVISHWKVYNSMSRKLGKLLWLQNFYCLVKRYHTPLLSCLSELPSIFNSLT